MTEDIIKSTKGDMEKVIADFQRKLASVRTGRATTGLLDGITVEAYGSPMALNQVATISAPEASLLTVTPFDPLLVNVIEKALRSSDKGFNPSNDGRLIRIPVPPLTEERRKQMAKQVHHMAEEHRTAVRKVRRDSNDLLKELLKDKEISEDDEKRGLEKVQELTNQYIKKIDELGVHKEAEIMKV